MLSPADKLVGSLAPSTVKALFVVLSAIFTGVLSPFVIDTRSVALLPTPTLPKSIVAGLTATPELLVVLVGFEKALASEPQPARLMAVAKPTKATVRIPKGFNPSLELSVFRLSSGTFK